jgi:hypothetical protein
MHKLRTTPEGEEYAYDLWNIIENRADTYGQLVNPDDPIDMYEGIRGRATENRLRAELKVLTAVRKLAPVDLTRLLSHLHFNENMSKQDVYMALGGLIKDTNGGAKIESVTSEDPIGGVLQEKLGEQAKLEQSQMWNSPLYCPLCEKPHGPYHPHLAGKQDEVQEYIRQVRRRSRETERLYTAEGVEVSNSEANMNNPNIYTAHNIPDWRIRRKIGDRDAGIGDYE